MTRYGYRGEWQTDDDCMHGVCAAAGIWLVGFNLYDKINNINFMTGVVFVLGYSTYFFELAGFADSNAFKLGLGGTGVGVCAFPHNLRPWADLRASRKCSRSLVTSSTSTQSTSSAGARCSIQQCSQAPSCSSSLDSLLYRQATSRPDGEWLHSCVILPPSHSSSH